MPEAVSEYIQTGNLLATQSVLDDLVISIEADFAKYKKRISTGRIREVFNAITKQNGSKFSYSYPNATLSNVQIKEVIELLKMAGLVYSITHSAANGIPLGAEGNPKSRKYMLFDTGILQRILGLNIGDIMIENDFDVINKGAIAEQFVGLELIKNQSPYTLPELYYWQRESKNSQAEVDFVIQKQLEILPIEVKAGKKGSMQSMYLFLKEKKLSKGIRISLENFAQIDQVDIYPLYAIEQILKG